MAHTKGQLISTVSKQRPKQQSEQQSEQYTSEDLAAEYSGYLTYRISQLSARLNAQATRALKAEFGLSVVQWRILALLNGAQPVNSAVLCKGLSMDAGLFSRTLKTLVEKKWVKISNSKSDKRQMLISLSRTGDRKYQQAAPVMQQRREDLTQGLTSTDQVELMRMLDILDHNAAKPI